ncbi:hypothetical protein [Pseudarthrobacter sp. H2]|uniref:hypothetical protein n=1 Tax=Pseudarthrobacter sp. H2 TaxID=3418415 RepID=UPI003CF0504D
MRLDRDAETQLEQKLKYLRTTVDGMKADQTFGASDVRMYRIANQSTNVDITLTNLTSTTPQCIEVTLTPNSAASNPVIAYDFAVNVSTTPSSGNLFYRYDPQLPISGVQKFRLYLLSAGTTYSFVDVGFTFWTISPATYSAVTVTP